MESYAARYYYRKEDGKTSITNSIIQQLAKNLDFIFKKQLTSKCKYAILYLQKVSKCKLNFERMKKNDTS